MDQKIRELWLIPIIISLVTGTLLGIVFLYISAWATGASIRPPFTLGWIRYILSVPLPLWLVLLFVAATAVGMLYLRDHAEKKFASVMGSVSPQRTASETEFSVVENSAVAAQQPTILSVESPSKGQTSDSLVISSPDQFSLRFSKVESGAIRGIQIQIENYRLTSIHQIRVILSGACSYDGRHGAFREAALTGQSFSRPDVIRPSNSGKPIMLLWKAPQWAGLVTGESNVVRQLLWPDRDKSDIQRWKLSIRVLAFDRSSNAAGQSIPLKELNTDIVVLWASMQNQFSLENPRPAQFSPAAFPTRGEDGVNRTIVRFIMCGEDQLLAYTTSREHLPGTRFLVVRTRQDQEPQSLATPDSDAANAKWIEWYLEWKIKGFGGASGNGLDGAQPF